MKKLSETFIKKYPVTFICVILAAITTVVNLEVVGLTNIYKNNFINNLIIDVNMLLLCIIVISFLITNVFEKYNHCLPSFIREHIIVGHIVNVIISIAIYFISRLIFSLYGGDGAFIAYPITAWSIFLVCYFIVSKKEIGLAEYTQKIFINQIIISILNLVMLIGTGILFFICNALFKYDNWMRLTEIIMIESIVVNYIGLFISLENVERDENIVIKVMIKYIMCIMVMIGFVFFYIYLIKIIITKELPSNQVFLVCTILFTLGLSTALMGRSFDEGTIYDKIIKYLPMAFIPAFVLQVISVVLRINQYGFTTMRYMGVMILIFEIAYIVLYIFKYNKLKYIYIVGIIIIIIMTYIPIINITQFPDFYNSLFSIVP
ncbi:MAG: DUF4153 domain-containing protein [Lachnospiraceae bacterium]|nr:DUF4153 domain-containing protein [Lachnospiraceae bacterium]